ncbi:MAG TPA: helix-hairpin-helix domain-containing protein [Acidimicrobiales bacterium]|nr:helix-hairpin-helix domain-containing protein [Acidimicrobiales bacterium]
MPDVSWWRSLRERMEVLPFEAWQVAAAALLVVVVAVGGLGWAVGAAGGAGAGVPVESTMPRAGAASPASSTSVVSAEVVVHVAGAVAKPGLYRVPGGSRVADAVAAAGSATADADLDRLNLAAPVADGERVYVPRRGEAEPPPPTAAPGAGGRPSVPARVNLNTATVEQLEALPGVGPSTARAIVDYRTRHGPFRSVRELLEVRGIGEAKLAALEKLVYT